MSRHRQFLAWWLAMVLGAFAANLGFSAEAPLPPRPTHYFNDGAGIVDPSVAQALEQELTDFERSTSNQLVVAIFPHLPANASTEDFTVRTAHAWGVGQKDRNNGAILFVFVAEHAVRIEVGYGLEPVLTDATSSQIIRQIIVPAFHTGHYAEGLEQGLNAMMAACRGEYRGTGQTHAEQQQQTSSGFDYVSIGFFMVLMLIAGALQRMRRGNLSQNPARRFSNSNGGWYGGFGGGGFGGGGSSGGGFSGGGGNFGGGGAGGNW